MNKPIKLRPVIPGSWTKLFHLPDLGPLAAADPSTQDVVDHHAYRGPDGRWQLWATIRRTGVGHLIYRWSGDSFARSGWEPQGVALRADQRHSDQARHPCQRYPADALC
jgi:hypothetical protein